MPYKDREFQLLYWRERKRYVRAKKRLSRLLQKKKQIETSTLEPCVKNLDLTILQHKISATKQIITAYEG